MKVGFFFSKMLCYKNVITIDKNRITTLNLRLIKYNSNTELISNVFRV